MADYLSELSEPEIAAFYRRLALSINRKFDGDSLAAMLLLHWLDGGGQTKIYPAKYVRDLAEVRTCLRNTTRAMFLSVKPVPSGGIRGIVPRIRGQIPANPPTGPYAIHLENNVETPLSVQAKAAVGIKVDPRELDALYALHGFLLVSDAIISASKTSDPRKYKVTFDKWTCKASDEYHWDPSKHITVPNPDYGSKSKDAIAPNDREITIYHSNAIRVEKAGRAKAFHDESESWDETALKDLSIVGPQIVNV